MEDINKNSGKTESITKQIIEKSGEISENILQEIRKLHGGRTGLLVLKGPNTGEKIFINNEFFIIGRSPESDMILDDITVSRKHAVLEKSGKDYTISDAGSLNGSYLNGNIIEKAVLKTGDRIQIGKYIFMFFSTEWK
ncbi:MAG: FHA domain-containing protein [Actinobacteria bacterium]|nr:FHA domain-containing protein [Actinomycetota bacterium]